MKCAVISIALLLCATPSFAQETEKIPFAGGEITIAENADFEKIVSFNGTELAKDYVAFLDRIVEVGGKPVALVLVGPGGNACGANTLIIFRNDADQIASDITPGDCGTPLASASPEELVFVPFVRPGAPGTVLRWTPYERFTIAGELRFAPAPETPWSDLDPSAMRHPMDFFANESFYRKATALLGDALDEFTLGMGTSAAPEKNESGYWISEGCVPHACGNADTFLAVNIENETVFMVQYQGVNPAHYWPAKGYWPAELLSATSRQ